MSDRAEVTAFVHAPTGTISYVVADVETREAAVIDAVLDFDAAAARTSTASADLLVAHVAAQGLRVGWILETHLHADHLSAAGYIRARLGGHVAAGVHVACVHDAFAPVYNLPPDRPGLAQFDRLFDDGDTFRIGGLQATVLHVPGHTEADIAFHIGDALFVGDTLFMPDLGTARADFPGGDAARLFRSARRLLGLPPSTRIFVCHDYPAGRDRAWESSVAQQRRENIHVRDGISEAEFVSMRTARDATLPQPALLLAAMQVNLQGGNLPEPESNGVRYLRLPLDVPLGRSVQA